MLGIDFSKAIYWGTDYSLIFYYNMILVKKAKACSALSEFVLSSQAAHTRLTTLFIYSYYHRNTVLSKILLKNTYIYNVLYICLYIYVYSVFCVLKFIIYSWIIAIEKIKGNMFLNRLTQINNPT